MKYWINRELLNIDEQKADFSHDLSCCDDTEEVERISKDIHFEWQQPEKILRGRERFLWLCEKLGLPKKRKHLNDVESQEQEASEGQG